jgi:subtilisin family serine protease
MSAPRGQTPAPQGPTYVDGEVLVRFRPSATPARRNAALAARGARVLRSFPSVGVDRLRLSAGQRVTDAVNLLLTDADVLDAQPNYIRHAVASAPPNDFYWLNDTLWGMQRIQAQPAWTTYGVGDGTVVIADIDTGIQYTHPDLAANVWTNPGEVVDGIDNDGNGYIDDIHGIDTVNNDGDPNDDHGHGTHTSGTIAGVGNNSIGVVGVNWNAKVVSCKFLDNTGSGSDADAIECFNYVAWLKTHGVNIRVTSNSWGSGREVPFPTALKGAIDALGSLGIVNVFAAGNNGTNNDTTPFDPASFSSDSIISVAASNSDAGDSRASFSNWGATTVDLAAPGVGIVSTYPVSTYASSSGTSMAAPHVAGAAALLAALNPALTRDQIKLALMNGVDTKAAWSGLVVSGGRLNVYKAIQAAGINAKPTVTISLPGGTGYTAPALITINASATDPDGTVAKVDFYANSGFIGSDNSAPFSFDWTGVAAGTYSITAIATDNLGAAGSPSAGTSVTVSAPGARTNVALASNGGTASASSIYGAGWGPGGVINGDRKGLSWESGGGWNDATFNTYPDWLEVDFSGTKTIDEIDVFTVQDNYSAPATPTAGMTFSSYGLRDFEVQYWTGSTWTAVPGGTVTSNNLVWRSFLFSAITTSKIRVWSTRGADGFSRLTEVEAWGTAVSTTPPTVTLDAPGNGAIYTAPATISFAATASDSDGSIAKVDFFANGSLVGTDMSLPYTFDWIGVGAGTYALTAVATDNLGATSNVSNTATVTVNPPAGRANVALAANGGTALASSIFGAGWGPSGTINGDRKGLSWEAGGGWNDGTPNTYPDWLEVDFTGAKMLDEIDVFTVQDNFSAPATPTPTMTFGLYGVRDFVVEYWTGSGWTSIPGGTVVGNSLVWRQFTFSTITTSKIRVSVTRGADGYSRLTEVEAYGTAVTTAAPTVTLDSPSNGSTYTSPATITMTASASDSDGSVAKVDFFANGALIGTDASAPYSFDWLGVTAGAYTLTAVATDNVGATSPVSNSATVTVNLPAGRANVALAANGGTAFASSQYGAGWAPTGTINGDRNGLSWESGGGWNDATPFAYPDWLEIDFNGSKTIDEIDVFTVQDNYSAPAAPTPTMTFSLYGVRDFTVEYWTGSAWATVPGGVVVSNSLVWRQFTFTAITTTKIRVLVTRGADGYSRLTEVEAYGVDASGPDVPASLMSWSRGWS